FSPRARSDSALRAFPTRRSSDLVVSPDPGQGLGTRLAFRGQLPRFLRDKPVGELRQRPAKVRLGPRDPLVPRVYRRSCDPEGPGDPRLTVPGPVNPLTEQPKRRAVALIFTLCHASTGLVNPHSPVNKNRREEARSAHGGSMSESEREDARGDSPGARVAEPWSPRWWVTWGRQAAVQPG